MNPRLYVNGIEEGGPSVVVRHTCNHERRHEYASHSVALADVSRQRAQKCPECRERPKSDRDRATVAAMARVRRARNAS